MIKETKGDQNLKYDTITYISRELSELLFKENIKY